MAYNTKVCHIVGLVPLMLTIYGLYGTCEKGSEMVEEENVKKMVCLELRRSERKEIERKMGKNFTI